MKILTIISLLLLLTTSVQSRLIRTNSSDLISGGLSNHTFNSVAAPETCEETYGFLPCANSILGNLFLILDYGALMIMAARYLSTGRKLLHEILGPGIIGGFFLPILGALPDALLIYVSGISGSKETAQDQLFVGMGLLAGSTVLLLTLLWGSCVILGKTDIDEKTTIDSQDTKGFSLTGSGISTDIWTSYAARLMVISVIPFVIVQLPQILHTISGRHLAVLISLIVSVMLLISYCLYQVFQPWIQVRKLEFVKHEHVLSGILRHLQKHSLGRLFTDDGIPNVDVIRKLFRALDLNGNGVLSTSELRALIIGIKFEGIGLDHDDVVQKIMHDFDTSRDGHISGDEFCIGVIRWLNEAKRYDNDGHNSGPNTFKFIDKFHQETKHEHSLLLGGDSDEGSSEIANAKWVSFKAVLYLLLGAIIAAAFSDPLVDAVYNFSTATSIHSFFISFIALPLAKCSEAMSALIFARRKTKRASSLTFSEIYGAVTMNNILCIAVFLPIVYMRELTWDFSAEVLVILIVCVVMGLLASFRTLFPLWTCSIAYFLYPFSLVLVYVLHYCFGWS